MKILICLLHLLSAMAMATSTYSIHHFTCDITKIFQSPLPSLCILFHPSLAPPFSSSIAHYTIPRNLKTLLHITLHYEFYRHSCTLYNTSRPLKARLHIIQYTTISQDTVTHSDSQCLSKLRYNVKFKARTYRVLYKCRN